MPSWVATDGYLWLTVDNFSMTAGVFVMHATRQAVAFASMPEQVALAAAGTLGSREDIELELDGILVLIRDFWSLQPDQVMAQCAAYMARLTELEVLLHRVEARDRRYKQIRTMQVQKILGALEDQFKIASRLVEVRRQDLSTMGGMV